MAGATCRWSWSSRTDKLRPEPRTPCEDVKSARNRAGLPDRSAGVLKTGVIPVRQSRVCFGIITTMNEDAVRDLMDCFYKENSQRIVFADMIPTLLVEYDQEFEKRTSLTKIDWCFLFVAIGLQLVRQYCLTSFPERKDDQSAAREVKGGDEEHSNRKHRYYNPSLNEIVTKAD